MKQLSLYINGLACEGRSGRYADGFDPARGIVTHTVPLAAPIEIDGALAAAGRAFSEWSATLPQARGQVLAEFGNLLERHQDELAELIVREQGKVLADARDEVARAKQAAAHASRAAGLLDTRRAAADGSGIDHWRARAPLGIVLGITPSSLPLLAPCALASLALACGNAFVLKPSHRAPSAALRMAQLLRQAGLPDGAFNVLFGDRQAADMLIAHRDVAAISFIGSMPAAQDVHAEGTRHGKRVQALGSAKHHIVVMPDADMDLAADALMAGAFGAASLRGMANAVAVAVGDAGDALAERLAPRVRALAMGDGLAPGVQLGPLPTAQHRLEVTRYIEDGDAAGAALLVDGRGVSVPGHERGFFLGGTLFDHVAPRMNIYREEIYGPVLGIVRVPDLAAAVALVNAHGRANAASCFTTEDKTARTFGRQVGAGLVGINVPVPATQTWHALGGWADALPSDASPPGDDALRFHTKDKTIMQRWPGDAPPAHDTGNPSC